MRNANGALVTLLAMAVSFCAVAYCAPAQPPAASASSRFAFRRVVVLWPEAPAGSVASMVAEARAARAAPRKKGLLALFAPRTSATFPRRADKRTKRATGEPGMASVRGAVSSLFADELADRLHARARATVTPEADLVKALAALGIVRSQAMRTGSARLLAGLLRADVVVEPVVTTATLRETAQRDLVVTGYVRMAWAEGRGRDAGRLVPFSATASCGRLPFRSAYTETVADLADAVARTAALQATHTLLTGEADPLCTPGASLAIVPVTSPDHADELVFSEGGRRVLPRAIRGLRADVSNWFTPDLLPLPAPITRPRPSGWGIIAHTGAAVDSVWSNESEPDRRRVQAVGRTLGVEYVLMAHITDVEVDTGPPALAGETAAAAPASGLAPAGAAATLPGMARPAAPAPVVWESEARAEAVGALVRVSDGAVLWRDRALASTADRRAPGDLSPADRVITERAIRFALVQLQRRFHDYRATFAR
jgi:hypothetical protein